MKIRNNGNMEHGGHEYMTVTNPETASWILKVLLFESRVLSKLLPMVAGDKQDGIFLSIQPLPRTIDLFVDMP